MDFIQFQWLNSNSQIIYPKYLTLIIIIATRIITTTIIFIFIAIALIYI